MKAIHATEDVTGPEVHASAPAPPIAAPGVIAPTVPATDSIAGKVAGNVARSDDHAAIEARSSDTAQRQLLRYVNGMPPEMPERIVRLRDILQRNAAEDMRVAESLGFRSPQLSLLAWTPLVFPQTGAEWYLRARDLIYRYTR